MKSVFSLLRTPCCNRWGISEPELTNTRLSRVSHRPCLVAACIQRLSPNTANKSLPLPVSQQQQRVASALCCTRQPGAPAPCEPAFLSALSWEHLSFACSIPCNPYVYPMCNSEVPVLCTGKYLRVEVGGLHSLAYYSCTTNTRQKLYTDVKKKMRLIRKHFLLRKKLERSL